ncbi:MAG: hypothetical protein WDA71_12270 [Actinomycetota bacterium]
MPGIAKKQTAVRFLLLVGLIDLAILVGVGVLGLARDWVGVKPFARAAEIAGMAFAATGFLSWSGTTAMRGDWRYQFAQSAGPANSAERAKQSTQDVSASLRFNMLALVAGGVAVIVGTLIELAAG